jgi:hypothetical protein
MNLAPNAGIGDIAERRKIDVRNKLAANNLEIFERNCRKNSGFFSITGGLVRAQKSEPKAKQMLAGLLTPRRNIKREDIRRGAARTAAQLLPYGVAAVLSENGCQDENESHQTDHIDPWVSLIWPGKEHVRDADSALSQEVDDEGEEEIVVALSPEF